MRFDDLLDFDAFPWPSARARPPGSAASGSGGRAWKWFERGDLKFAILGLIEQKPMHGYEVMQELEAQSAGCYRASPGSVYPTLQLLEDQGLVTSRDHGGRKIYTITDDGRAHLDENRDHVNSIFERVSRFSDRLFGRDMAELSRKFSHLARTTFQSALGWIEDEQLFKDMKAVLDRAVKDMDTAWDEARERWRAEKAAGSRGGGDAGDPAEAEEASSD
ncbi:MAG: PadR family transcriptional regulator [Gemmatimonadota bacterium]|nr:PadR family transcriptional regulator [Gemmatimonadota bacterium]